MFWCKKCHRSQGLLFVFQLQLQPWLGLFGGMKVVGGVALGPRERIVLVEVGDTWLVIGLVPGQIRTLYKMPKGELSAEVALTQGLQGGHFADLLKRVSQKGNPQ